MRTGEIHFSLQKSFLGKLIMYLFTYLCIYLSRGKLCFLRNYDFNIETVKSTSLDLWCPRISCTLALVSKFLFFNEILLLVVVLK